MPPSRALVVGVILLCVISVSGYAGPSVGIGTAQTAPQPAQTAPHSPPTELGVAPQTVPGPSTATSVGSCTKITKPGHYVLARDIHNGKTAISTGCLKIRADDVVLDGRGHTLDGFGVSDTSGVHVDSASNVTVRNFRAKDWNRGVYVEDSSDVTVRDVVAANNAIGIEVSGSDTQLVNNVIRGDFRGVVLADSWDDELRDNRIHHNHAIDVYAPVALVHAFGFQLDIGPPLDPDDDGRYEDVSGDGEIGVWDAMSLPVVAIADTVGLAHIPTQQRSALDFDGDGTFDGTDVLAYAGLTPSE